MQKEAYLLELTRYVVLNPVRGRMVPDPLDWPLSQFGAARPAATSAYRRFALAGLNYPSPLDHVRDQVLLGDEAFVTRHQQGHSTDSLREVSKAQRRSVALGLPAYRERYPERAEAMARVYFSGAYTMAEIGVHFGLHYVTVSRAVKRFKGNKDREDASLYDCE